MANKYILVDKIIIICNVKWKKKGNKAVLQNSIL